jgi:DNA polymerase III subunit epsilon
MLNEPVIVLDFETTGLDPRVARLTEVAALRIEGDRITGRFETLVDPGVAVPASITELTGISTEMLRSAPKVGDVIPALRRFIGGACVVAHHGSFDQKFYEHELRRRRMRSFSRDFLCTVRIARRVVPGLSSYGLASLARHCGALFIGTAHRATADAEVTVAVLMQLTARMRAAGVAVITPELLRQLMRCPVRRYPDFVGRHATRAESALHHAHMPQQTIVGGSAPERGTLPLGWNYRSSLEPPLDLAVAEKVAGKSPIGRNR